MRVLVTVAAVISGLLVQGAVAQETDPRALEACQRAGGTFVQISECLPEAHVALKMIDAFATIYPPDASPLRDRCIELNKSEVGAVSCITDAIEAAIKLAAALPSGSALDDPIFNAVKSPDLFRKLEAVGDDAKKAFPDKRLWGMNTFFPYR